MSAIPPAPPLPQPLTRSAFARITQSLTSRPAPSTRSEASKSAPNFSQKLPGLVFHLGPVYEWPCFTCLFSPTGGERMPRNFAFLTPAPLAAVAALQLSFRNSPAIPLLTLIPAASFLSLPSLVASRLEEVPSFLP
jgi:hypothetical protein